MTTSSRRHQRGVAAVEFALVFTVLFLVVYGLATFGAVLYTQQAVSRSAEDGARAVALLNAVPATNDSRIQDVVYDSLAGSLVVPTASNASLSTRRSWVAAQVTVAVTPTGSNPNASVVVTVTYPYSANRLLPSLPLLDTSLWMPDQLKSRSTAAIQPT
jgi:Flp pilus assembly protein TadG